MAEDNYIRQVLSSSNFTKNTKTKYIFTFHNDNMNRSDCHEMCDRISTKLGIPSSDIIVIAVPETGNLEITQIEVPYVTT